MQIAVGIEAQLGRAVEAVGQILAGITQGLEMADGVWMLERGHGVNSPGPILPP